MSTIQIVYSILMRIAGITGFSYNETNIIAHYIILPFAYVFPYVFPGMFHFAYPAVVSWGWCSVISLPQRVAGSQILNQGQPSRIDPTG